MLVAREKPRKPGRRNVVANKTGMTSEEIVKQRVSIGANEPKGSMGKDLDPLGLIATVSGFQSPASLGSN